MRIQSQAASNQLNSIQRAFNTKQAPGGAPSGLRAIDQFLIDRQQLNKALQVKPADQHKPVKINRDPVVIKPTSAKKPGVGSPPATNKPLATDPNTGATSPKSKGNSDVVQNAPPSQVTGTAPIGTPVETPPQPGEDSGALTLQGLNAAWGTSNPQYDINGDGTVNTADLLQFINSMPAPGDDVAVSKPLQVTSDTAATVTPPDEAPTAPILTTAAADAQLTTVAPSDPATPPTQQELTLDGLVSAWGQTGSPYDLNNDGTVNVGDLLQFINNMPGSKSNNADGSGAGASGPQQPSNAVGKPGIGGVTKLADALIDRLMKAGFDSQPPTNIRELVDTFHLPTDHSQKLFDRLQQRYPNGLGVNMVA